MDGYKEALIVKEEYEKMLRALSRKRKRSVKKAKRPKNKKKR